MRGGRATRGRSLAVSVMSMALAVASFGGPVAAELQPVVTAGNAQTAAAESFSDVPPDHVFADDIAWLATTGITQGRDDGTYGLNDPVTRGAMAAFLHRYDASTNTALAVSTEQLPLARRGLSYGTALDAHGGQAPYHWEVGGLPAGLEATTDGLVTGVVEESGTWTVDVEVRDDGGRQASARLSLEVVDVGVPDACIGQECALLEPFDGQAVEIEGTTVRRTTLELEPEQVDAVQLDGDRVDDRGTVHGTAQLTLTGLAQLPEIDDVLVVPEQAHPEGHLGPLIVQVGQVTGSVGTPVEVAGPLVGLLSAYHSGVLHIRQSDTTGVATAGMADRGSVGTANAGSLATCERDGTQEVSVEVTPQTDGDVHRIRRSADYPRQDCGMVW